MIVVIVVVGYFAGVALVLALVKYGGRRPWWDWTLQEIEDLEEIGPAPKDEPDQNPEAAP